MKHKKFKFLATGAFLLCLMCGLFGLKALGSTKATEVEASNIHPTSGFFRKVLEANEISIGDKVIIVSETGHVLDDVWGNPGFLHGTSNGIQRTNDRKLAYLTESPATVFTVEEGLTPGTFSFKGSMGVGGSEYEGVYLAQHRGLLDGEFGEGLAFFFEDGFGVAKRKSNEDSSVSGKCNTDWYLKEQSDGQGVCLEHSKGGVMAYVDIHNGVFMRNPNLWYHYPYTTRYSTALYKQIVEDETSSYSIAVEEGDGPKKTNYTHGEEIDLSGLRIHLKLFEGSNIVFDEYIPYAGNPNLFSFQKYAYGNGARSFPISFAGKTFHIDIFVSRLDNSVYRMVGTRADYRGTYMLVAENEGTNMGLKAEEKDIPTGINSTERGLGAAWLTSPAEDAARRVAQDANDDLYLRFEVERDEEMPFDYNLICKGTGKYLSLGNYSVELVDGPQMDRSAERVQFEYDEIGVRIKGVKENSYIFLDGHGCFRCGSKTDGTPVYLWKYDSTDAELTEVNNFVADFLAATDVCDPTGQTYRITKDIWQAQREAFDALSVEAKGFLANVTYTHNQERTRSIEDAMNRYDYIVTKYRYTSDAPSLHPEDYPEYIITDFIGRIQAGTNPYDFAYAADAKTRLSFGETSASLLVLAVGMTALAAFGIFMIIRKRSKQD